MEALYLHQLELAFAFAGLHSIVTRRSQGWLSDSKNKAKLPIIVMRESIDKLHVMDEEGWTKTIAGEVVQAGAAWCEQHAL